MIQTDVSFATTDKALEHLYERAKHTLMSSIRPFGERRLLTDAPNSDTITLNYSLMGAETLADYDAQVALDSVSAFLVTLRKDGRLPSSLSCRENTILPSYERLTGLCFAREALNLCYLTKNKNSPYTQNLYDTLCRFDEYLWSKHDLNANGCLEILEETECEEGLDSGRFPPLTTMQNGEEQKVSPFPVETFDLMAEAFGIREVLAELALMLGHIEDAKLWREKASTVQEKIRSFLWLGAFHACFDRDCKGGVITTLSISNLFLLYFGVADTDMARNIVENHILNPEEFRTPMPLPTLAKNHIRFNKNSEFGGPPRGTTYRRALRAFDNYGYYSLTTEIGQKLLHATKESDVFPVCFDETTGEALNTELQNAYAPTASAVLETIRRFFGVYADHDTLCWGCLGNENATSTYRFTWGNDIYLVETEDGITTASINGNRLFTVTSGTRIFTDVHGDNMRIANATDTAIDCICVCRNHTYSLHLKPNEIKQITTG